MELDESYSIVLQVQQTPLQITTLSLPNVNVGTAYNVTLQAAGGTPPYVWTLVSAVPNTGSWLACSGAGKLTGTPGTSENETVTVRVQDSSPVQLQTQATYGFTVNGGTLSITTSSPLPTATVGTAYNQTLSATGGTQPYTWSQISATPDTGNWIATSASGHITGTPTTAETESLTVQVVDSSAVQQSQQKTFSLPVQANQGGNLTIVTSSPLPNATVGQFYSTSMAATGGTTPYTWSIISDVPDTGNWLTINAAGNLSGTPGTAETETVVIKVTDAASNTAQGTFTLTVQAASSQLSITTASLPNAIVGTNYSAPLAATGGTPPYNWSLVSASPNTDLWLSISGANLIGIPELTDAMTVIVQVSDAIGNTAQASFNFNCTVSGALAMATPSAIPNYYTASALTNGTFALRMLAKGGQPPYHWAFSGPAFVNTGSTTGTLYALNLFGWLQGASVATSGTDTMTVVCTDNNGATVSQTVTVSSSNVLGFYPLEPTIGNSLNLPTAYAGTPYQYQFHAAGGSGTGYTFTVNSGLPSGMSLSSSGLLTGNPTLPGNASIILHVTDSASNLTTTSAALNILSRNVASRPAYNTGSGFFVDGNGFLRDSSGYLFTIRGLNRTHYDSTPWNGPASGALARPNTVRVFMFDGQTAAFAANQVQTQYAPNNILSCLALAGSLCTTSGNNLPAVILNAMSEWLSYQSALSPVMSEMVINIANEWGPSQSAGGTTWLNAYLAVIGNISNISGTTVTVNSAASTNPFISCPFAYVSGAGGITNQLVWLSSPGGVAGAWTATASPFVFGQSIGTGNGSTTTFSGTLTAPVLPGTVLITAPLTSGGNNAYTVDNGTGGLVNGGGISTGTINYATGAVSVTFTAAVNNAATVNCSYGKTVSMGTYTSGGTLNGGAVGILRAGGYTCPLVIDAGSSGEDPFDITAYSAQINNSDPQKNCIFSLHPYQGMLPFQALVGSITKGNPTVLTLTSNWSIFPLNWGASGAPPFNAFNNNYQVTGAQGVTSLNGTFAADEHGYGSAGAWQVHLSVDSTAWTGTYVANSATIVPANQQAGGGRNIYYQLQAQQLAALRSGGVCAIVGEFGPGNQSGNPATPESSLNSQQISPGEVITACEANQLGWIPWAWDDHNGTTTFPADFAGNWFPMVAGNNGVYTANNQFTAFGLDAVANPRTGLWSRATPAASFLPTNQPNIAALPNGVSASPNWQAFISGTGGYSAWAINTPYTDYTGTVLRRITNRSTLSGGGACLMEYAEGGPRVSQPLGGGNYWIQFKGGPAGNFSNYVLKYQRGSGFVSGSVFTLPVQGGGNLGCCFSTVTGEQNILYIADPNSGQIYRYDCSLQAYAPNTAFNGPNGSVNVGVGGPGWLAMDWAGTVMIGQAPYSGPTLMFAITMSTGAITSYTGSPTSQFFPTGIVVSSSNGTTITVNGANWQTIPGNGQWDGAQVVMTSGAANGKTAGVNSNTATVLTLAGSISPTPAPGDTFRIYNVNEPHLMHGNPGVVWIEDNNSASSLPYAWFIGPNLTTTSVSRNAGYGGHSDAGASNLYSFNPNGSFRQLNEYTPGTAPATDGGAWLGIQTNYWGTSAANEPDDTGGHFNITWNQIGAGANEWVIRDSFGEPYNDFTAAGWTVHSGQIYQTSVNGGPPRGITGVLTWNGTVGQGSQITGSLTAAPSLAGMTAGSFFYSSPTLYVWLSAGGSPAGKVILNSNGLQTDRIAYYKQDGSQIRILCGSYWDPQDSHSSYYHNGGFPNASPDGLIVVFNSDLGTYSSFIDLVVAEVPHT